MNESGEINLKQELMNALKNDEFVLHYQPQFNLYTAQFESVEALIRWQHPKRGLLWPGDFIPFAEKEGELIVQISKWVLITACKQNRSWQKKGLPIIRVAVNVGENDISQENFPEFVLETLKQNHLHPSCLEIELTENVVFHNAITVENIRKLKKLGMTIALDDFGTGYSSIGHLKKIPIDKIKIAKVFIDNINANNDDATIVKAIIQLAASLNLQVVVEGVETLKQLQLFLTDKSVEIQGFYFSEPLPADEVEKFLIYYRDQQI